MEVKILKGGKIVGRYDDKANEMTTDDQRLAVIPHNGVTAINGSTDEETGLSETYHVTVKPGDPEFFFAFVDTIERMGYSVDHATEQEYTRRRRAQRRQEGAGAS